MCSHYAQFEGFSKQIFNSNTFWFCAKTLAQFFVKIKETMAMSTKLAHFM